MALDELFPYVKRDIKATLEVMNGLPVTIRLLDPPLHEFVPQETESALNLRPASASASKSFKNARTHFMKPTR